MAGGNLFTEQAGPYLSPARAGREGKQGRSARSRVNVTGPATLARVTLGGEERQPATTGASGGTNPPCLLGAPFCAISHHYGHGATNSAQFPQG